MDQGRSAGDQSRPDFARLVDMLPDMVLITADDGAIAWTNPAAASGFGWDRTELLRMNFLDLVNVDDRDRAQDAILRLSHGEGPEMITLACRDRGGDRLSVEWRGQCQGDSIHFIGRDVTGVRREGELVVVEQWLLKAVLDHVSLNTVLGEACAAVERLLPGAHVEIRKTDESGRILRAVASGTLSRAFVDAVGDIPIDPSNGGWGVAVHSKTPVVTPQIAMDGRWTAFRDRTTAAGLQSCWVLPLLDAEGDVVGTLASFYRRPHQLEDWELEIGGRIASVAAVAIEHDRLDGALRRAKGEAEAASDAKSQFIAYLSHEVRTPLNAVIGFAGMIERLDYGAGADEYVEVGRDIRQAGEHLLNVINDVLDLSRIAAGRMPLEEESVDLVYEIGASLRLVKPQAVEAGLDIGPGEVAPIRGIRGESRRIRQILINLLANAIHHTEKGGVVRVGVRRLDDGTLGLWVKDNGVGIAAEDIPRIMEPFRQASGPHHRQGGGSGLGLPLTAGLVELHGGRLQIESTVGLGTTVTALFPADRVIDFPA